MRNFFNSTMGVVGGTFTPSEQDERYISFLGDSITEGGDQYYINPVASVLNLTPVNGGKSGTALGIGTESGLNRHEGYIRENGKYVVLMGINDIGGARTATQYQNDLITLMDSLLQHYQKTDIVLCKILWCQDLGGHFTYQKLTDFNIAVNNVVNDKGVVLCDMYTPFVDRPDLFSDGLHPNAAGYEVMKNALLNVI